MADMTIRTRIITRREFAVPLYSGSNNHAELLKAIHAARDAVSAATGVPVGSLTDDAVNVSTDGAEIVVWFQTEERTR